MFVKKPIGPIKLGGTMSRLTVGQPVPKNILAHWKKTKQYDALLKAEILQDEKSFKLEKAENEKIENEKIIKERADKIAKQKEEAERLKQEEIEKLEKEKAEAENKNKK